MTHFQLRARNHISETAEVRVANAGSLEYIKYASLGMTDYPNGRGQDHVTRFLKFCPCYIFEVGETRHFKCRVLIDTEVYLCTNDR